MIRQLIHGFGIIVIDNNNKNKNIIEKKKKSKFEIPTNWLELVQLIRWMSNYCVKK